MLCGSFGVSGDNAVAGHRKSGRAAGAAAAVLATGALACGVCCVLPFALPAAALAASGGALAWLGGIYPWATFAAAIAVVVAWIWIVAQSLRRRMRPARSTLIVMAIATTALAAAVAWPQLEGVVVRLFRA